MSTITIAADEVQVGDFLPALDNGFVFETDESPAYTWGGAADGFFAIGFHDNDGNENYLFVYPESQVTVRREDD